MNPDRIALLGSLIGAVLACAFSVWATSMIIDRLPEPEPYEIPWEERVEESDTSLPMIDPDEVADEEDSSETLHFVPMDGGEEHYAPPCRSCGPDRWHPTGYYQQPDDDYGPANYRMGY